ncbi:hypothetical protein G4B88_003521 [Cannabis sativa]|uniref:Reverse transcriptase zinc-binding domain-containing protein n=1 Tax=Cannabis sativa TaxID=3483 RepID=A0A7J6GTN3_CANSA|nr:hypothetical protein G4B88_003521 [Cannabis sativa]
MEGYRWCVGDERTVRINEDPWLPRSIPSKLRTKVLIPKDVTINSLLTDKGNWKINEVESWFHKDDIPWVLGIIPNTNRSDWITWSLNANRNYSVASGYKIRFRNPDLVKCSNNSKASLTPKMKIFIWKVFNHWLPSKVELEKRGIALNTLCDWCKSQKEDTCHALWGCPKVQHIWEKMGFFNLIQPNINKPADVLWWLWDQFEKDKFLRFVGYSWLIWLRRNNFIFNNKNPNDHIWVEWAMETIEQLLGSHQQKNTEVKIKPTATWIHPPAGFFSINTDAALNSGLLGCGLSAIIRNHTGELIVAEVVFLPGCLSVQLAETAAIRLGVKLALRWSIKKARLSSDCQTIVKALNTNLNMPTDWEQMTLSQITPPN